MDISIVFLQSGDRRTAHLLTVGLRELTGVAVHYQCHQYQIVLDRLKEFRYFHGREIHRLNVPRQHPAPGVKYRPDTNQEIHWVGQFSGGG
jgi:hypothetical protein